MNNLNKSQLLYPQAIQEIKSAINKAQYDWDYLSGITGEGPIDQFETKLRMVVGGNYCLALSNCTSALYCALLISNAGPETEVILPAYTWPQTLSPVLLSGATPVLADIGARSFTIDPNSVIKRITKRTRAIIGVHLFGYPADAKKLQSIAKSYNCSLIFDAAQGFGCGINNGLLGQFGDFVAFSFGKSKLFSIGEGGALIFKRKRDYHKALALTQHPIRMHKEFDDMQKRERIDGLAMNFRMHPLIASLALGQLNGLIQSEDLDKLKNNFSVISQRLSDLDMADLLPDLPLNAQPCGEQFPVIWTEKDRIMDAKTKFKKAGLEIFNGSLQNALNTLSYKRYQVLNKKIVNKHDTHDKGSCPNAERCSEESQLFVKLR